MFISAKDNFRRWQSAERRTSKSPSRLEDFFSRPTSATRHFHEERARAGERRFGLFYEFLFLVLFFFSLFTSAGYYREKWQK